VFYTKKYFLCILKMQICYLPTVLMVTVLLVYNLLILCYANGLYSCVCPYEEDMSKDVKV